MDDNLFSLSSKVAIVTGGLGKLGRQFSKVLVKYGARVVALDITDSINNSDVEFNEFVSQGLIKVLKCDIVDSKEVKDIFQTIIKEVGVSSILVNNAAIDSPPDASAEDNGPFETYPIQQLQKVFNVNVVGTIQCCQTFGSILKKNNMPGSVINISSIYGNVSPNQDVYQYKRDGGVEWYKPVAYSVTKGSILNLTRYLATYWAKNKIRVNTVSPAGIFNNQDYAFLNEYLKRVPIGRMAEENELNGAIIFLASDASSYMTGANLIIDGGWTAW